MHSSMPVELPYNLSEDELVLDPACVTDEPPLMGWWGHFSWLVNTGGDDEEIERVLRGIVLLKAKHPEYTLEQCAHTAIIWERG